MSYTFNEAASTFSVKAVPVTAPKRDIVDEIDALVDEQMAEGEPRQGYDFDDPTYPKCPHCDRHWHGLAVTERIASMYSTGYYDEAYSATEDDSPVLCEGSEFIGPTRPEPPCGCYWCNRAARAADEIIDNVSGFRVSYGDPSRPVGARPWWIEQMIGYAERYMAEMLGELGMAVGLWLPGDTGDMYADQPGDPYGSRIEDGQRVTFIGPDGRSFTDVVRVVGGPGEPVRLTPGGARITSIITVGEGRPYARTQYRINQMAMMAESLATGQHVENRLLPMRLEDV